jgi:hypothetical protein
VPCVLNVLLAPGLAAGAGGVGEPDQRSQPRPQPRPVFIHRGDRVDGAGQLLTGLSLIVRLEDSRLSLDHLAERPETDPLPVRQAAALPPAHQVRLPLAETPCPSCTSILDSLDGAAPHLAHPLNFVVVAKSDPARIGNFAQERGWRNLRLLSSRNNNYNRDYHAESPEGEQSPVLNVFTRDGDGIRHRWATELMFAPREEGEEPRHVDLIWPIWNVLDMTPGGRGSDPDFPAMQYR